MDKRRVMMVVGGLGLLFICCSGLSIVGGAIAWFSLSPESVPVTEEAAAGAAISGVWGVGLVMSLFALAIGGGSAVLGIWVGRDQSRPAVFSLAMSVLILSAVIAGGFQSYLDAEEAVQKRQELKRMMGMVVEIAEASGDPELIELVKEEAGVEISAAPEVEEDTPEAADEQGE